MFQREVLILETHIFLLKIQIEIMFRKKCARDANNSFNAEHLFSGGQMHSQKIS